MGHALKDAFRSVATSAPRVRGVEDAALGAPMVWTFDGPFATCLADLEDALRRALVQVGTVTSLAVLIQLSLPALKQRVQAGDVVQPTWGQFLQRLSHRYGLPAAPRVRHVRTAGPLATLIVVYRS